MTVERGPVGVARASSAQESSVAVHAPESPATAARRLAALAALVPPFAHKMGNALGAVTGLIDLTQRRGAAANASWLPEAREQARLSHELVQLLARLARPPAGRAEPEDLGALIARATTLIEPLAQTRGARTLAPRVRGTPVARVDGTAALQWLCIAAVEAFGPLDPAGQRPEAMRFAARGSRDGAELSFCLAWRIVPPARAALEACPHPSGDGGIASLRARTRAVRAVLHVGTGAQRSAVPAALPAVSPRAGASAARRLLLFEPDAALGDLMAMVLAEAGYAVERAADAKSAAEGAARGAFDLVLADAAALDARSARALARAAEGNVALGWLGAPAGGNSDAAALPKPFRPADLLAYVEARLPRA